MKARQAVVELAGREVVITNPDKLFFPQAGHTKLDLVRYYAAVAEGALRGVAGRPIVLKRYVDGAAGEPFFQKRAPEQRPEWIETVELRFPSGRTAREIVVRDAAQLLWMVNLGCIDLNPHPVRADDLEHPDELRVDLDPGPGVSWDFVRRVTLLVRDVLDEHGLRGWPKTSGSRGMHVNVRIERRWSFAQVRRAALALAREVERRAPDLASSKWWKEERRGVFLDYNQNAKDRTVASAWSVRPTQDARVSMPLEWDEVADCDPAAFTLATAPARFAERGDASAAIDSAAGSLDEMLNWLVNDRGIEPHIPVFDKSERTDDTFSRKDFVYDHASDSDQCPAGKTLQRYRRQFTVPRIGVMKDNSLRYRASKHDCGPCPLKPRCCPNLPARKVTFHVLRKFRDPNKRAAAWFGWPPLRRWGAFCCASTGGSLIHLD
jgi:bifunctional non-homologous end joining protein LigD